MAYQYFNSNPAGNFVGDCVIRAITKVVDQSWDKVYVDICLKGLSLYDMPSSNRVWGAYLKDIGFDKYVIPNTCPECYSVIDFARDNPYGNYILGTGSHVIAVSNGDYYDTWDSGDETPIYYFKRR